MKKIIRLTERDLSRIVRRVINEREEKEYRVVMMPTEDFERYENVDSNYISKYSEETDKKTFEHKGSALRHAENIYEKMKEENPDEDITYIVVDNDYEGYASVPGVVKGPLVRRFTGFHKGY